MRVVRYTANALQSAVTIPWQSSPVRPPKPTLPHLPNSPNSSAGFVGTTTIYTHVLNRGGGAFAVRRTPTCTRLILIRVICRAKIIAIGGQAKNSRLACKYLRFRACVLS
jgi:hypothetical protein